MFGFVFGALAGGIAGYYWRDRIRNYMSDRGPDLRNRVADTLDAFGDRATGAMDRARSRIDSAVRIGQSDFVRLALRACASLTRHTGMSAKTSALPR